ncbi:integral membrane YwaF-like protein [Metamycoplasma subdolum]|uniref:Integral membrane YwaF-like protein n=1 Tax=Metamycoplasma subdolum TaxID=92407 RepID=A0A3M0A0K6_9BACT|nr:YwaF family protein [Metamycoplasma subdolum]RMA78661.1 integral membrane YwaF-like protein [Metamycoplasma subdolum]WPB50737.1 YwaF family protein [Metamycoplasma subdolum]
MLFDKVHWTYIILTFVCTILLLAAGYYIKKKEHKNIFLGFFAWGTFLIHISTLWVDFFINNPVVIQRHSSILITVYFCNLCMFALLFCSMFKNKEGRLFKHFATFVAWGGTIGSLITTFYPDFYMDYPTIDWGTMKSMMSHTFMLIGCLYLFVGKYIKLRVSNLISFFYGLVAVLIIGLALDGILKYTGKKYGLHVTDESPMYIYKGPIPDVKWLTGPVIALFMMVLIFIIASIYEAFLPKEERWYNKIKAFVKTCKEKREAKKLKVLAQNNETLYENKVEEEVNQNQE